MYLPGRRTTTSVMKAVTITAAMNDGENMGSRICSLQPRIMAVQAANGKTTQCAHQIHQVNKMVQNPTLEHTPFSRFSQRCSQMLVSTHTKCLLEQFSVIALGLMSMTNTKWDIAHIKLQWPLWTYDARFLTALFYLLTKSTTQCRTYSNPAKTLVSSKAFRWWNSTIPKQPQSAAITSCPSWNQLSSSYSYERDAEGVELSWLWVMRGLLTKRRASRRESVCQACTAPTTTVNKAGASTHGNTIGTNLIIIIIIILWLFQLSQKHLPRPPLQLPASHASSSSAHGLPTPKKQSPLHSGIKLHCRPIFNASKPRWPSCSALLCNTDPPRIHNPFKLSPRRRPVVSHFKYFQRCPNTDSSPPLTITYFHAVQKFNHSAHTAGWNFQTNCGNLS